MTDLIPPNETLQSQLSAFVDDELPQAETDLFVRRLVKDTELKQTMGRYQLMAEALRAPASRTHLSRDFSARIAAALEQQEGVVAVAPIASVTPTVSTRWRTASGMALAASVALAAVLMVRNQPTDEVAEVMTAEILKPVMLTAQRVASTHSYVVPSAANAPTAPITTARLTNYVVAHSEFSSPLGRRNMMTGLLAGDQPVAIEIPVETAGESGATSGR